VGRIIMIGAAIILAIVFLPGLMQGGSGGAKNAGGKAADSIVNNAKDPQAVVDGANNVIAPVKEVATPWWEWLIAQPWFYAALAAGIGAFLLRRVWANMGGSARLIVVGLGVGIFMIVAIGVGGR
jgi:hypothetical protein